MAAEEKEKDKPTLTQALQTLRDIYNCDLQVVVLVQKDRCSIIKTATLKEFYVDVGDDGSKEDTTFPFKVINKERIKAQDRPNYLG